MKKILTIILFAVTLSIFAGQLKNTKDGQKKKKAQSAQQITKEKRATESDYENDNEDTHLLIITSAVCHVRYTKKNGKTCDGVGYGRSARQACRRARRDARRNCR